VISGRNEHLVLMSLRNILTDVSGVTLVLCIMLKLSKEERVYISPFSFFFSFDKHPLIARSDKVCENLNRGLLMDIGHDDLV